MNRKALVISLSVALVAIIGAGVYFWVRSHREVAPTSSSDAPFSGFGEDTASNPRIRSGQNPCDGAANIFEQRDCLKNEAKSTATTSNNQNSPSVSPARPVSSYQAVLEQMFSARSTATINPSQPSTQTSVHEALSDSPSQASMSAAETQARYDLSFGAPLAVYAPSKYEVLPGEHIQIYGAGFTSTGNILSFSGVEQTVSSADGATLDAVAPGSVGNYEIWVTNVKGSSRVASRPIKITVTSSPAPLPVISSASPNPVALDGTVELVGTGFSSSNIVLTSLGYIENVSSSIGSTLRFSLSALPYLSFVKDTQAIKGKVMTVMVMVKSAGGVSAQASFNVQF